MERLQSGRGGARVIAPFAMMDGDALAAAAVLESVDAQQHREGTRVVSASPNRAVRRDARTLRIRRQAARAAVDQLVALHPRAPTPGMPSIPLPD